MGANGRSRLDRVTHAALACICTVWLAACTELPAHLPAPGEEPHSVPAPTRPRLALVLSGGSLRGFAHVGVLRALDAHGIHPDLVVGTSVGAIVGAVYASGVEPEQIMQLLETDSHLAGANLSRTSSAAARPHVYDFVRAYARGHRIEQFPIAFAAVATDLQQGCLAVFNAGDAAIAVQASTGLPGLFAPTRIHGRDYADGGLASPLPVRVARTLGASRVIAVDVTFPPSESRLDGMIDRVYQIGLVMVRTLAALEGREADVLIAPQLPDQHRIKLDNRAELIAAGERAALDALPRIRALLVGDAQRLQAVPLSRTCEESVSIRPQSIAAMAE